MPQGPERYSHLPLLAFLVLLPLAGCDLTEPTERSAATVGREEFIAIVVALRRARSEAEDAEAFEERKARILERHDATPEALLAFVEAHGADVRYMAAVWDSIRVALEPPPPDSAST